MAHLSCAEGKTGFQLNLHKEAPITYSLDYNEDYFLYPLNESNRMKL